MIKEDDATCLRFFPSLLRQFHLTSRELPSEFNQSANFLEHSQKTNKQKNTNPGKQTNRNIHQFDSNVFTSEWNVYCWMTGVSVLQNKTSLWT